MKYLFMYLLGALTGMVIIALCVVAKDKEDDDE